MIANRTASRATAIALLLLCSVATAGGLAPSISPNELQDRKLDGSALQILDVRSAAEYAEGHVPGAVNIPHTELAGRLDEVRTSGEVVLYCMVGPRARMAEKTLVESGATQILHLEGGMTAWLEDGLPVEKSGE